MEREAETEDTLKAVPRRDFLHTTACLAAAVGVGGAAWALLGSLQPAADVKVPELVGLADIAEGMRVVTWVRGIGPVLIAHRTPDEIAAAREGDRLDLPDPALDQARAVRSAWLVALPSCTFRYFPLTGVDQAPRPYWLGLRWLQDKAHFRGKWGGLFCQQCGSHFDTSGRARKGSARRNLVIPRYRFVDAETLEFTWWAV